MALLPIGSLFFSCVSNVLEHQNDFEISENAWMDFKKSSDNSYTYTVVFGSWVGFSWETTLTVIDGSISKRHFKYTTLPEDLSEAIPEEELEWTENETELGSHQNGAEPMTLDEVYTKAQLEWLVERENAITYFERENNGMISTCGYVENNCVDDCFTGIKIARIEAL
ncbi:hypothetical protein G9Q97_08585 [Cyclobacterium sp. GBPx2]|uniref:DUF4178 domain-containing protein n=2 Tax=Cyclobacterium plantarum TaxID=2716263 RepID=A0ABX0H8X4_9BACT|nr:hypothetical protein [Cyclobacterium plantarum]